MFLSPILNLQLRPKLSCWVRQSRALRPSIKVGREKFQLTLDVRNFDKDEIRVKARPEYLIVEGKHEKKTKKGLVVRQFYRKFKLPEGCRVECMESKLSPEGVLTVTAPRRQVCKESSPPCETFIPISDSVQLKQKEDSFVPVNENICKNDANKSPGQPPCSPDKKV